MSIMVTCSCGKEMRVPREWAGKRGKCKICGASVAIPTLAELDRRGVQARQAEENSSRVKKPMAAPVWKKPWLWLVSTLGFLLLVGVLLLFNRSQRPAQDVHAKRNQKPEPPQEFKVPDQPLPTPQEKPNAEVENPPKLEPDVPQKNVIPTGDSESPPKKKESASPAPPKRLILPNAPGSIPLLKSGPGRIAQLAFSADSRRIVCIFFPRVQGAYTVGTGEGVHANVRTVRQWEVETGKELPGFDGKKQGSGPVQLAPMSSVFLSADRDVDLRERAQTPVGSSAFRLWAMAADHEKRLWEYTHPLPYHFHLSSAIFSPGGRWLLSWSSSAEKPTKTALTLRVVETGNTISTGVIGQESLKPAALSADGQWALINYVVPNDVITPCRTEVWNAKTWQKVHVLSADRFWCHPVGFSPDARLAYCLQVDKDPERRSENNGYLGRWEVLTGKELPAFRLGHSQLVELPSFACDGRRVLLRLGDDNGNSLRVMNLQDWQEIARFEGHTAYVTCAAFSPDGRFGASGDAQGNVRLWRLPESGPKTKS